MNLLTTTLEQHNLVTCKFDNGFNIYTRQADKYGYIGYIGYVVLGCDHLKVCYRSPVAVHLNDTVYFGFDEFDVDCLNKICHMFIR